MANTEDLCVFSLDHTLEAKVTSTVNEDVVVISTGEDFISKDLNFQDVLDGWQRLVATKS
jgi:hypothetical protein